MPDIVMFVEDQAHYEFLKALLDRLAQEYALELNLQWQNVRHGHGKVIRELKQFLRDMVRDRHPLPDLLLVAIDANCKGLNPRTREVTSLTEKVGIRTVCAIPDPHIERWLLLDSAAFKEVFGRGCKSPDRKCERGRYKKQLSECILATGTIPPLGGIEYSGDIVRAMDLARVAQADASMARLLSDLRAVFHEWQQK